MLRRSTNFVRLLEPVGLLRIPAMAMEGPILCGCVEAALGCSEQPGAAVSGTQLTLEIPETAAPRKSLNSIH